jgi:hypothetical protein
MVTDKDGFELLEEDQPMDILEKNDMIKLMSKGMSIVVISPAGNKEIYMITNPNQNFTGLKKAMVNLFS